MSYMDGEANVPSNLEIERKFLVAHDGEWRNLATRSTHVQQTYIAIDEGRCVRVRIDEAGEGGLTVKTMPLAGTSFTRLEIHAKISSEDARALMTAVPHRIIEKTRFFVPIGNHTWEIDEFSGLNFGLCVAEIELASETETFDKPAWVGTEVTDDPRFLNQSLAVKPFSKWNDGARAAVVAGLPYTWFKQK